MRPEQIYKPFGLARATFYGYAEILDHHTDEEIKYGKLKNKRAYLSMCYLKLDNN
ncbi:hypothetical protein [Chryseobacterium foetidum]|uniref:hypothetical protein n=1 Tax=Chryseobacterium foetidum TaxID=2951057 RepID=UPI0021CA6A45|nr:hypothetical protein [Chryseobacterium foetidum]